MIAVGARPNEVQASPAVIDAGNKIMLSIDALEAVRAIAPGWDKHFLERKFLSWAAGLGEPLKLAPDQAFHAWARKFTKGKRP
jgi:hypothetical protein